jgi:hypothetical protein
VSALALQSLSTDGFEIEWFRKLIWGSLTPYLAEPVPAAVTASLKDGTKLTLVPIHTPGHCADHHVVYVPETGWLFGADIFLTTRPSMAFHDEDCLVTMRTLEALLSDPNLHLTTLFCSHKGVVADARGVLTAKLQHLRATRKQLLRLWTDDSAFQRTIQDLTREVLGAEPFLSHFTQGKFSPVHMARSLLGGYEGATAARKRIGTLTPAEAIAYLEGSGVVGPGAASPMQLKNPQWLAQHRISLQEGGPLGQLPRIPGTGLPPSVALPSRRSAATALPSSTGAAHSAVSTRHTHATFAPVAALGVSPAAAAASAAKARYSAALRSQPRPGTVTLRDAQQAHKSATDQVSLFPQAQPKPRWGASLVSGSGKVIMPDGSFASADIAADAMVDASLSRQSFRQQERRLALESDSPVGQAYARQLARTAGAEQLALRTGHLPGPNFQPTPPSASTAALPEPMAAQIEAPEREVVGDGANSAKLQGAAGRHAHAVVQHKA